MTVLTVLTLLLTEVSAAPKVSGKDWDDLTIKYDTKNIKSYGRIVTGIVNYSKEYTGLMTIKSTDKHILFCGTGELYEYEGESNEYNNNETWINTTRKFASKDHTLPLDLEKSDQEWTKFKGLNGYYKDMLSKCSGSYSKFPRIDVPVARSEGKVFHAILDTYGNDGKLKNIWVKEQKIDKTEMKDLNGQPLLLGGETMYEFNFSEPRNYSMSRWEVDCKSDKLAISQIVEYKAKGEVLKSDSVDISRLRLDPVIPNSIGEAIHKFTCGL